MNYDGHNDQLPPTRPFSWATKMKATEILTITNFTNTNTIKSNSQLNYKYKYNGKKLNEMKRKEKKMFLNDSLACLN